MSKLAPFFGWLKKNRFWLGCSLVTIAMIAMWFLRSQKIDGETAKFTQAVKTEISSANNIMQVSAEEAAGAHPNTSTEAGMKAELKKSVDAIVVAWRQRYEMQQPILKWPTEIIGSEEFVKEFSRFDPPERFPEKYKGGYGLERYLELYRATIPKQMAHLCKDILRAKWNYDPEYLEENEALGAAGMNEFGAGSGMGFDAFSGGATMGAPPSLDDLSKFAVIWDDVNQEMWYKKLTQFRGLDDHVLAIDDPTPLQVYMLQQDLWLLEAMFNIIRKVNGDADANDLAVIKRIDHVAFGREARTQLGKLTPVDPRLSGIGLTATEGEEAGFGAESYDPAMTEVVEGAFDKLASFSPYHGRYVDVNFEPLPAETVRTVLTSNELPAEHLELIVAKRVPVRIALRMDERKIPEFMTECANSPFAFEINQVRLNRHIPGEGIEFNGGGYGAASQAGMAGGMGMDMGMDMDMGMEMGFDEGFGGDMMSGGLGPGAELPELINTPVETRVNYDVDVEFYGIVKIYNPVREKFLRRAIDASGGEPNPSDAADRTNPQQFGITKS